jgi:tRNA (cmo5U34)-methyltransferase
MENVIKHFNEEAQIYDINIQNLIPYYNKMLEAILVSLPFKKGEKIEVIDFGCGTGTIAKAMKIKYPEAFISCLDIAENMLKVAEDKLRQLNNITYIHSDVDCFEFDKSYDLMVSSLALHHLRTDESKYKFYKKCYDNLKPGGLFFNADVVLASSDALQKVYMKRWIDFMRKNVSEEEIENVWLPTYYNEDCPVKLTDHLKWMYEIGFKEVDVIWKYYNFAVYTGKK